VAVAVVASLIVAALGNNTVVVTDTLNATRVRPQRRDDRSIV